MATKKQEKATPATAASVKALCRAYGFNVFRCNGHGYYYFEDRTGKGVWIESNTCMWRYSDSSQEDWEFHIRWALKNEDVDPDERLAEISKSKVQDLWARGRTPEEVSKVTGLSVDTVLNLVFGESK